MQMIKSLLKFDVKSLKPQGSIFKGLKLGFFIIILSIFIIIVSRLCV